MKTFMVPATEINQRLRHIQRLLQANRIDGMLIVQRVDLFYFSGTAQHGYLFIPADGEPLLCVKRYLPRARKESSLHHVIPIVSVQDLPARIIDHYGRLPTKMALEYDVLPVKDFQFYRQLFNECDMTDGSELILEVRKTKSRWEIDQIEQTAEMSARTFDYMEKVLQPDMTEMEFAGLFEAFARQLGHSGKLRTRHYQTEAYPWHVLSGENGGKVGMLDSPFSGEGTSPAFPCGAGQRRIQPHEPILVDFGSMLNGYHMDETRMFSIGKMPPDAHCAGRAAIDIHNNVLDRVKPEMTAGELFDYALRLATDMGHDESYLGPPEQKISFIGHGIGLELIEPPFIAKGKKDILKPGMTFALEPKFCYKGKFAAGVESVFQVTDSGARLISKVPVRIFYKSK
jgi:Xaa-Pro aminopeptidase